jgi:flagellar motor switch protein FliG
MKKDTSAGKGVTNRQKAALLMLSLDVAIATRLMKGLTSEEIEYLTVEIASLKGVYSTQIDSVIEEFHQLITAQEYVIQGGWEFAHKLLESSLGPLKAKGVMDKVKALTHVTGFAMLKKADPKQLSSFLQKEHPQTIALVLSNLSGDQTSGVLAEFPDELRNEVTYRIATLGKVSPTLLTEIEDVLSQVAEAEISQNMSTVGGTKSVANILNKIANATGKNILEYMESKDPNLANEVKRLMFMFEDIVFIDDRGIQRLLREVDKKDLALSMKVAEDNLKEKILKNMSERAQELLKEELQFMGPVRLKEVEAAQTRIVMIVRQLEDSGELVIAGRGGKEEVIV